jgi:hypothetical protein
MQLSDCEWECDCETVRMRLSDCESATDCESGQRDLSERLGHASFTQHSCLASQPAHRLARIVQLRSEHTQSDTQALQLVSAVFYQRITIITLVTRCTKCIGSLRNPSTLTYGKNIVVHAPNCSLTYFPHTTLRVWLTSRPCNPPLGVIRMIKAWGYLRDCGFCGH